MNKKALRADAMLLLTAAIWGFAFVAQKSGMEFMGPYLFNSLRFFLGSASLLPLVAAGLLRKRPSGGDKNPGGAGGTWGRLKRFALSSLAAGGCLFIAASLQQIGIIYTTTGHSGFITGLYVVIVPIAGIFLGRRTGLPTWLGAGLTLTGLFFLSATGNLEKINPGDLITVASAFFWAFHVLIIDFLAKKNDPIRLSCGQFFWCGLFSLAAALAAREIPGAPPPRGALVPLLYGGLCSVGIAYTLQVAAQKEAPPAHATIILCLEGVFAALGGFLILHDPIGPRTLAGFLLMLCGTLVSQWEIIGRKK